MYNAALLFGVPILQVEDYILRAILFEIPVPPVVKDFSLISVEKAHLFLAPSLYLNYISHFQTRMDSLIIYPPPLSLLRFFLLSRLNNDLSTSYSCFLLFCCFVLFLLFFFSGGGVFGCFLFFLLFLSNHSFCTSHNLCPPHSANMQKN